MFWSNEELSCFGLLALMQWIMRGSRKVMIPMMILFRLQGLSGWQWWFSSFGDFLTEPITFLPYFIVYSFRRNLLLCLSSLNSPFLGLLREPNVKLLAMSWNIQRQKWLSSSGLVWYLQKIASNLNHLLLPFVYQFKGIIPEHWHRCSFTTPPGTATLMLMGYTIKFGYWATYYKQVIS